jgi:hypothetical protein
VETSWIRPEGAATNQPRASPGDRCNAFARALKGRNIANPLLRPFRASFPREFPFPGRCPGLICSAPSGRNPKQRNIKTRQRGSLRITDHVCARPSLARCDVAHFRFCREGCGRQSAHRIALGGVGVAVGVTRRPRGARRGSPDPAGLPDRQVSRAHRGPRFQRCSRLRSLLQTKETYRSRI